MCYDLFGSVPSLWTLLLRTLSILVAESLKWKVLVKVPDCQPGLWIYSHLLKIVKGAGARSLRRISVSGTLPSPRPGPEGLFPQDPTRGPDRPTAHRGPWFQQQRDTYAPRYGTSAFAITHPGGVTGGGHRRWPSCPPEGNLQQSQGQWHRHEDRRRPRML